MEGDAPVGLPHPAPGEGAGGSNFFVVVIIACHAILSAEASAKAEAQKATAGPDLLSRRPTVQATIATKMEVIRIVVAPPIKRRR